jgi:hypothetical protein
MKVSKRRGSCGEEETFNKNPLPYASTIRFRFKGSILRIMKRLFTPSDKKNQIKAERDSSIKGKEKKS